MTDRALTEKQSPREHSCIKRVSPQLEEERNTRLMIVQTFSLSMSLDRERLVIATEKVDPKKRGKAVVIFATYCPFCGEKL